MKMSLLDMVQDILNDLDSDEVNSIDDTVEAMQVAQIIKTTYFALMSNRNWPHLRKQVKTTNGSLDRPTTLYLEDEVTELVSLNYDVREADETRRDYKEMKWLEPDAFLRKTNSRNSDDDSVTVIVDDTGVELLIDTTKAPQYYTSFDDNAIIFDSYDAEAGYDTLLSNRVQALAYVAPSWETADDAVPNLPDEAFISLLEESKHRAFIKLKQSVDQSAYEESARQKRWLSRKAWRVEDGLKYPNYGRGRSTYGA